MKTKASKTDLLFSVIVPTVGREKNLISLIKKLKLQKLKSFEVIIVVRSIDKKIEEIILSKFKNLKIHFIKQKGDGLVNARNTGLFLSKAEYVVFTDDDVEPSKNWLSEIYKTFIKYPDVVGATGPSIIPPKHLQNRDLTKFTNMLQNSSGFWKTVGKLYFSYIYENKPFAIGKWFKSGAFSLGANFPQKIKIKESIYVMDLQACNFAVRRNEAVKHNGFDKNFSALASYSESDFAFRLREQGGRLMFNPKAVVYHLPSQGGVFIERTKSKTEIENYLLFYFRHIKIKGVDNFFRFCVYFILITFYRGLYQSNATKNIQPLIGVIQGTITGFKRVQIEKKLNKRKVDDLHTIAKKLSKYFSHPSVILWRSLELLAVKQSLRQIKNKNPMLDLGCGEGKVAEILFGRKFIDIGLDPEPTMITKAKKYGVYKKVVAGDARDIPISNNKISFIFSNSVVEHIPNINKVISEVSRILEKDGQLMFTVPNQNLRKNLFFTRLFNALGLKSLGKKYSNLINNQLDHFNLLTNNQWKSLFKSNGLELTYIASYLDKKQTAIWEILRLILFPLKFLEGNKTYENLLISVSNKLLININTWECESSQGSCTILIATKK